jgi:hypothetical protein
VLTGCSIAPTTQRFGESAEADTTHRADDAEVRRERRGDTTHFAEDAEGRRERRGRHDASRRGPRSSETTERDDESPILRSFRDLESLRSWDL